MPFYAVKVGKKTGIYETWDEAKKNITGVKGAKYKKFDTISDANDFMIVSKQTSITEFVTLIKEDPKETENNLICFTDGSAINNGFANAKAAFGVVWPFHPEFDYGEPIHPATNNRAEYSALIHAIRQAEELDPSREKTLIVYTDSMLLINSLTKWLPGWRKNGYKKSDGQIIMNLDLVKILEAQMSERKLSMRHVKAHTGGKDWESIYNDKVDKLAKASVI
jgi:ribonuclease HI